MQGAPSPAPRHRAIPPRPAAAHLLRVVVGDTDGLDKTLVDELLHGLPRVQQGNVVYAGQGIQQVSQRATAAVDRAQWWSRGLP